MSEKNTSTAQSSKDTARGGDSGWVQKRINSPDCEIFKMCLADNQDGNIFYFKRERSDDEGVQGAPKRARN